jgi:hypothetical protein
VGEMRDTSKRAISKMCSIDRPYINIVAKLEKAAYQLQEYLNEKFKLTRFANNRTGKTIANKQRYKRMKKTQLGKVVQRKETNKPERRDPNP